MVTAMKKEDATPLEWAAELAKARESAARSKEKVAQLSEWMARHTLEPGQAVVMDGKSGVVVRSFPETGYHYVQFDGQSHFSGVSVLDIVSAPADIAELLRDQSRYIDRWIRSPGPKAKPGSRSLWLQ